MKNFAIILSVVLILFVIGHFIYIKTKKPALKEPAPPKGSGPKPKDLIVDVIEGTTTPIDGVSDPAARRGTFVIPGEDPAIYYRTVKIYIPKKLTPGSKCSTAAPGDIPNNYGTVDYAGRCLKSAS